MTITREQYESIEKYFPKQRGNVMIDNYIFVNAILYIAESGCKWRELPGEYGKWSTVYKRYSRWSKNGIMEIIFDALTEENLISAEARTRLESVLD